MSASGMPARSQGAPAKRAPSVSFVWPAIRATDGIACPSRLQTSKPPRKNGDTVFDPETFLARAGLGKQILSLKRMRRPTRKATLPTRFFTCRRAS